MIRLLAALVLRLLVRRLLAAYGTPSDPVTLTVITVAYAVANLLNPIRALRSFTGGADPPGTGYVVTSDSVSATTWKTLLSAVSTAFGQGTVTGNLTLSGTMQSLAAVIGASGITNAGQTILSALLTGTTANFSGAVSVLSLAATNAITAASATIGASGIVNNGGMSVAGTLTGAAANFSGALSAASAAITNTLTANNVTASNVVQGNTLAASVANGSTSPITINAAQAGVTVPNLRAATAVLAIDNGVPDGAIVGFETLAELTAAGAQWARYTAGDGRLLIGAGTTFSQTFTEATDYGANWTPGSGLGVNAGTLDVGGTMGGPSGTVLVQGGAASAADHLHTHSAAGLTVAGSPALTGTSAAWLPPARAVIWGRKV